MTDTNNSPPPTDPPNPDSPLFSLSDEETIDAILTFIEDDTNPATLSGYLAWLRDSDDAQLDEFDVRERARERGIIQNPE
jgi:hypothetical protein